MAERDIGQELLGGLREIKAHKGGKVKLRSHKLKEPSAPQIIRTSSGFHREHSPV